MTKDEEILVLAAQLADARRVLNELYLWASTGEVREQIEAFLAKPAAQADLITAAVKLADHATSLTEACKVDFQSTCVRLGDKYLAAKEAAK
jgi:hypothetical protein